MHTKKDDILNSTCVLFRRTDRMHRRIFEVAVGDAFGIHRSQHMMLMCLSDCADISQKELADRMKISPAAVAVTVKKLEAGGFIERRPAQKDGRQNSIVLTEKGRNIVDKTHMLFVDIDNKMLDGISDEELKMFNSCLDKMQKNLEEYRETQKKGSALK